MSEVIKTFTGSGSINFEEELEQLVSFEKNKQLNQFSLLFYKKLKQNTVINEY